MENTQKVKQEELKKILEKIEFIKDNCDRKDETGLYDSLQILCVDIEFSIKGDKYNKKIYDKLKNDANKKILEFISSNLDLDNMLKSLKNELNKLNFIKTFYQKSDLVESSISMIKEYIYKFENDKDFGFYSPSLLLIFANISKLYIKNPKK